MPLRSLLALLLAISVTSQGPGNGISKQTYACTDPQRAFTWWKNLIPIHCGDLVALCNSTGACGQKGRSNFCASESCNGDAFSGLMFHMVPTCMCTCTCVYRRVHQHACAGQLLCANVGSRLGR